MCNSSHEYGRLNIQLSIPHDVNQAVLDMPPLLWNEFDNFYRDAMASKLQGNL